jgi:hypothetical protein
MDKHGVVNEAILEICESDYDGSEAPEIFEAKVTKAVESCWSDGMSLDALLIAARSKLGFAVEGHDR